jgi:hypothetical protein
MWTNISQRENLTSRSPSKQNGFIQQGFGYRLSRFKLTAGQGVVPNVTQE